MWISQRRAEGENYYAGSREKRPARYGHKGIALTGIKIDRRGNMVHDTPSRQKARELKKTAKKLEDEAYTLAAIEETRALAAVKAHRAKELSETANTLADIARLEDITVRQAPITKQTEKGEKTYYRWLCSWREGDKIVTKHLGSVKKVSHAEALVKAKKMKAEALGIKD